MSYVGQGVSGVSAVNETGNPWYEAELPATTTTYYVGDHLGSVGMQFSATGQPTWQTDYTPFGQEISPNAFVMHYKYTGFERDPESSDSSNNGLDHAQFRQYSSPLGRWMSPDPYNGSMDLSNPQSLNRYAYVGNRPLVFVDPSGLDGDRGGPGCGFTCEVTIIGDALITLGLSQLFGHNHPLTIPRQRSNRQPWDEHSSVRYGPNIAGALGLPSGACEFGACGSSFAVDPNQIEAHHVFAQEFTQWFVDHGLPEYLAKFTIPLMAACHRLRCGPGVHTKAGGDWNGVWREWIANNPNASPAQIIQQGWKMLTDFGIGGPGTLPEFFFIVDPCSSAVRQSGHYDPRLCGSPLG